MVSIVGKNLQEEFRNNLILLRSNFGLAPVVRFLEAELLVFELLVQDAQEEDIISSSRILLFPLDMWNYGDGDFLQMSASKNAAKKGCEDFRGTSHQDDEEIAVVKEWRKKTLNWRQKEKKKQWHRLCCGINVSLKKD